MIDPDNPAKIRTGFGMILMSAVFGGIGLIFVCVGLIPLIVMGRKAAVTKKLIQAGSYIYAVVESIDYNTGYAVDGQNYKKYHVDIEGALRGKIVDYT